MCNRTLYTYISVRTYMHPHWKSLHPRCSWSRHRPDYKCVSVSRTGLVLHLAVRARTEHHLTAKDEQVKKCYIGSWIWVYIFKRPKQRKMGMSL